MGAWSHHSYDNSFDKPHLHSMENFLIHFSLRLHIWDPAFKIITSFKWHLGSWTTGTMISSKRTYSKTAGMTHLELICLELSTANDTQDIKLGWCKDLAREDAKGDEWEKSWHRSNRTVAGKISGKPCSIKLIITYADIAWQWLGGIWNHFLCKSCMSA